MTVRKKNKAKVGVDGVLDNGRVPTDPNQRLVVLSLSALRRMQETSRRLLQRDELPPMVGTKLGQLQTFLQRSHDILAPNETSSAEALREPAERNGVRYETLCSMLVHDVRNKYLSFGTLIREIIATDQLPFHADAADQLRLLGSDYASLWALIGDKFDGPLRPAAQDCPAARRPVAAASVADAARTLTGRILVVDDDPAVRQRIVDCLRQWHHFTLEAESSDQAERLINDPDSKLDLILLDLDLGATGPNGLQLLKKIQQDFELRAIPVIVISGSSQTGSIIDCIMGGAEDYLEKGFLRDDYADHPSSYELLRARVFACLRKGKMQRNESMLRKRYLTAQKSSDNLLHKVFPYMIAEELRTTGKVQPRQYENVAVLFSDVVGFTQYCEGLSAIKIVDKLNQLFTLYDDVVEKYQVEKIKTIGDCLMVTAGLLRSFDNPVLALLTCAHEMRQRIAESQLVFQVRTGIHAGSLVAGMVGRQMTFDVWGDTVNTAQRVETAADPSQIVLSVDAWSQVYQYCRGRSLGFTELKGKKPIELFQFEGFRSNPCGG